MLKVEFSHEVTGEVVPGLGLGTNPRGPLTSGSPVWLKYVGENICFELICFLKVI